MSKAIIIDDEEMARTLLHGMLKEYCPNIEIVQQCSDLPSGVKAIHKYKPDLVFLDIEMPGHSGLELLDFFDENDINFSIIFITAYHDYAIQAFKLSAIDYLLKPVEIEELVQAVNMFEKRKGINNNYQLLKENLNSSQKKITLSTSNSIFFIPLHNILFFKADGAYTQVFLDDNRIILTSKNLKHYEDLLFGCQAFYRCHRSFIINIEHVSEYVKSDGGYLKVREHQIYISADKTASILEKIGS